MTVTLRIRSKTALKVLDYLQKHPGEYITSEELVKLQIMDTIRQARYALNFLLNLQLVNKIPDLRDCRSSLFYLKKE